MGPLGHHNQQSLSMHPQTSHGTRSGGGAYDKLKKKMGTRQ